MSTYLVPCNYIVTDEEEVHEDCVTDPEEQFKYLSTTFRLEVLHNSERLVMESYGEEKIVRQSQILQQYFNPREPEWFQVHVQMFELEDETEVV